MKDFAAIKTVSQLVSDDLKQKQKRMEVGIQYHQEIGTRNFLNYYKKQAQMYTDLNCPYLPSYLQERNAFDKSNNQKNRLVRFTELILP